jgi:copper chaperone CopZ
MKTVKFKVSELNNDYMEKTILAKLKGLDGVLDVSVDAKSEEVTLSVSDPSVCEGVYCLIEDLGYTVHRP